MTDNLPILYRNIMLGLPSEIARDAFLWAVERPGEDRMCYRAEAFAREVATLVETLAPMLRAAANSHEMANTPHGLTDFILTRHANWRFGGNLKPSYLEAT